MHFLRIESKEQKGREEKPYKISTAECCQTLKRQAPFSNNERIKTLVRSDEDLIAKEAEYHKTCRVQFNNETKQAATHCETPSVRKCHQLAFSSLKSFMEEQVKTYSRSLLVSNLYHIYLDEFLNSGGVFEDFHSYTIQAVSKKLRQEFGDKSVTLSNKSKKWFDVS